MATIHPAPGEEKAIAQMLLTLAKNARDVRVGTDTPAGTGYLAFDVPEYLYDKYMESVNARAEVETEQEAEAAPKRRGRPRKAQAPTATTEEVEEESEESDEDEE